MSSQEHETEHPTGKPPEDRLRIENRFWSKVDYGDCDENECWEWTAATTYDGYGMFNVGTSVPAHRVAYALATGKTPGNLDAEVIRHRCHTRACQNPRHLEPGTVAQNARDSLEAGRWTDTPDQVIRKIRERYEDEDVTQPELATEYGLSQGFISNLVRGEQCTHVE